MKRSLAGAALALLLTTSAALAADTANQPNTAPEPNAATAPGNMATARSTATTENLGSGMLPISDYYNKSVYDTRDNKVGDVNDLLVDKNGKIDTVIIGVGGFIGIGEKNVAVPFSSVKVADKDGSRYLVLETTKEALQSAPGYTFDSDKKVWVPAKQG
jgi:sporulation protein YlmC with PRC-barrel domain